MKGMIIFTLMDGFYCVDEAGYPVDDQIESSIRYLSLEKKN